MSIKKDLLHSANYVVIIMQIIMKYCIEKSNEFIVNCTRYRKNINLNDILIVCSFIKLLLLLLFYYLVFYVVCQIVGSAVQFFF